MLNFEMLFCVKRGTPALADFEAISDVPEMTFLALIEQNLLQVVLSKLARRKGNIVLQAAIESYFADFEKMLLAIYDQRQNGADCETEALVLLPDALDRVTLEEFFEIIKARKDTRKHIIFAAEWQNRTLLEILMDGEKYPDWTSYVQVHYAHIADKLLKPAQTAAS